MMLTVMSQVLIKPITDESCGVTATSHVLITPIKDIACDAYGHVSCFYNAH